MERYAVRLGGVRDLDASSAPINLMRIMLQSLVLFMICSSNDALCNLAAMAFLL